MTGTLDHNPTSSPIRSSAFMKKKSPLDLLAKFPIPQSPRGTRSDHSKYLLPRSLGKVTHVTSTACGPFGRHQTTTNYPAFYRQFSDWISDSGSDWNVCGVM